MKTLTLAFRPILSLGLLAACVSAAPASTQPGSESGPSSPATLTPSPSLSPMSGTTIPGGGCRPFSNAELNLGFNDVNQVRVSWSVDGGCPPFSGTLVAWYQDELHPSATYAVADTHGRLLDPPIIHRGTWDRDYYLTITDSVGHRLHLMETITIGG